MSDNDDMVFGEVARGESRKVELSGKVTVIDGPLDNDVLVLGKEMVRIDLRDPDLPPRCVGPFTKVGPN